jgi:hypothetical protein
MMTATTRIGLGLALAAWSLAAPGRAEAEPAYRIDDTAGPTLVVSPFVLGFEFTATRAITVSQLGVFDYAQDGLAVSHEVGLFDAAGQLLVSATVAAGTVDPLIAQFRYADITPVTLVAGRDYRLGAVYASNNDPLVFPTTTVATGFVPDPAIAFVGSRSASGAALADPSTPGPGGPGYFGPNLILSTVPEPSTIVTTAIGVVCLGGYGWRRREAGSTAGRIG